MSTSVIGNALINVRASLDQLDRDLARARRTTESSIASLGAGMERAGLKLTRTLTPAAAGMGLVFRDAFREFDAGADAIRSGTGLMGKELESVVASMKRVGSESTQGLAQVGRVMADVQTRTGLTGPPLERLTKQLLDLDRIGNAASAETVTRVFGDWGIATHKQSAALDTLFRASQATGPSIDRLGQLIVQYGAPLRAMGFSFAESAALLGKFEKEGVNTELVLGSMRIALAKFAREGESAPEALQRLMAEIKAAPNATAAAALGMEVFGARAGADMAAAIREGRFELGDLLQTVEHGKETISSAAADTLDWSDKFKMLRNRVYGVIGPVGEMGMAVAGVAAGIGPALIVGGKFTKMLGTIGSSAGQLTGVLLKNGAGWIKMGAQALIGAGRVAMSWVIAAGPWLLLAAAIAAIVILVVKNWDKIKAAFGSAIDWIKGAISTAVDWIKGNWDIIAAILFGPVGLAVLVIRRYGDQIVDFFTALPGRAVNALASLAGFLWGIFSGAISGAATAVWNGTVTVVDLFAGLPGRILGALGDLGSLLWGAGMDLISGLWEGIKAMQGWLLDKVSGIAGSIKRTITSGFGIFSPSKVMRGYGVDIALGLGLGIEDGSVDVQRAMSMSLMPAITQPLSAALPAAPRGYDSRPIVVNVDGKQLFEIVRDHDTDNARRRGRGRTVGASR
jgi:phage-related minor tail protein